MTRHHNRTVKGDELMRKHEEQYKKWWLGKRIDLSPMSINDNTVKGLIEKVEYIGNSVYGIVRIMLDNGVEHLVSSRTSFRPKKEDLKILDE